MSGRAPQFDVARTNCDPRCAASATAPRTISPRRSGCRARRSACGSKARSAFPARSRCCCGCSSRPAPRLLASLPFGPRLLALGGADNPVMIEVLSVEPGECLRPRTAPGSATARSRRRSIGVIGRRRPPVCVRRGELGRGLIGFGAGHDTVLVGVELLEHGVGDLLRLLARHVLLPAAVLARARAVRWPGPKRSSRRPRLREKACSSNPFFGRTGRGGGREPEMPRPCINCGHESPCVPATLSRRRALSSAFVRARKTAKRPAGRRSRARPTSGMTAASNAAQLSSTTSNRPHATGSNGSGPDLRRIRGHRARSRQRRDLPLLRRGSAANPRANPAAAACAGR